MVGWRHSGEGVMSASLPEFKLAWLEAVHGYSRPTSADLHVAHSMFNKYVSGVGLPFEAPLIDIAADVGITRRGLQRVIRHLTQQGLMCTKVRRGRGRANEFLLTLPAVNNQTK